MSTYWYAMLELSKLFNKSFESDIEGFKNSTKQLCSMTYKEVKESDIKILFKYIK